MGRSGFNDVLKLLLLNALFICGFFYPVLGSLNTILMSGGGDGIKNYFCYLYFIRYDQGTHFTGMNYPFGEHMIFTDNLPALSWSIAKIKHWFPQIADYSLVLLHSTFLVSYWLCALFLYKILRLYSIKGWWAVCAATFIAYFSPQFFRLLGHFSLALVCFFPMVLYWIMCYNRTKKKSYLLFFLLLTILFSFLHVYYLAFSMVLSIAYCFSFWMTTRVHWKKKVKHLVPVLMVIAIAIFFFKGTLAATDRVSDRPSTPYGFLGAATTGPDILTSGYSPIGAYAFSWLFGEKAENTEGYVYLGLVTILTCLFLLYRIIKSIVLRIRKIRKSSVHPVRSYRLWLLMGLFMLLFGMGVPFTWGMDFLVDYLSIFKQFRSLGRFSWVFYYLIMLYAAIFLHRLCLYLKRRKYSKLQAGLILIVIALCLIEWNGYAGKIRMESAHAANNYQRFFIEGDTWRQWLQQRGYPPEIFQGQIGLPYTHIGSDRVVAQDDPDQVIFNGASIAFTTGLKMTDVMMSRTSWSQTFANMRLIDGPFAPKDIVDRFNDKPVLVFVCQGIPLTPGEQALVDHAKHIGNKEKLEVYALDIKSMVSRDLKTVDSLKQVVARIPQQEGLIGAPSDVFVYNDHFEHGAYRRAFAGKGAMPAADTIDQLLEHITVKEAIKDSLYTLSAWFLCRRDVPEVPSLSFRAYGKDGAMLAESECAAIRSTYVTGDWYKAEKTLHLPPETTSIQIAVKGSKRNYIALDELLLCPLRHTYFYKSGNNSLLLNNRPFAR